ncbi:MAG: DNA-protecting protein DprA [Anaerolineae bacterium]|nr:DNA-protecting protein DprA [Anaerolineae bacterium]
MADRKLRYWVGFNRAKGIGPIRLRALLTYFGDIETAWNASPKDLQAAGLDQRSLTSLLSTRSTCDLDAELRAIERAGAWVLTLEDTAYPPLLRQIPDPPPILYGKGTLTEADNRAIAVVGTRRATVYGKTMTEELVDPLARHGFTIVSGLARGIDSTAHQIALNVGGRTLAVMANGIDRIYPPENRQLAEAIVAQGALLSELPLGEPPESKHFAPRNRIVSGLSLGTVVIEAAEHSGALMTANQALEQGRDVFAVPGNALSPASRGTNALIQTGAIMVTRAQDILDELNLDAVSQIRPLAHASQSVIDPLIENETEALVLRYLSAEPQHIDDVAHQSGLSVVQVSSTLTILELRGLVRQMGSMQYALAVNIN